jgi:TM2 domain-containing membrane protein YozV
VTSNSSLYSFSYFLTSFVLHINLGSKICEFINPFKLAYLLTYLLIWPIIFCLLGSMCVRLMKDTVIWSVTSCTVAKTISHFSTVKMTSEGSFKRLSTKQHGFTSHTTSIFLFAVMRISNDNNTLCFSPQFLLSPLWSESPS